MRALSWNNIVPCQDHMWDCISDGESEEDRCLLADVAHSGLCLVHLIDSTDPADALKLVCLAMSGPHHLAGTPGTALHHQSKVSTLKRPAIAE